MGDTVGIGRLPMHASSLAGFLGLPQEVSVIDARFDRGMIELSLRGPGLPPLESDGQPVQVTPLYDTSSPGPMEFKGFLTPTSAKAVAGEGYRDIPALSRLRSMEAAELCYVAVRALDEAFGRGRGPDFDELPPHAMAAVQRAYEAACSADSPRSFYEVATGGSWDDADPGVRQSFHAHWALANAIKTL